MEGTWASCALKEAKAGISMDWGLPPCSQASLEGDGALSRGTARRKLLQHHFPYLVFPFEVISGKYDMAEHAGALRARWALGIFGRDPAGLAWPCAWGAEPAPTRTRPVCKGGTALGAAADVSEYTRKKSEGLGRLKGKAERVAPSRSVTVGRT